MQICAVLLLCDACWTKQSSAGFNIFSITSLANAAGVTARPSRRSSCDSARINQSKKLNSTETRRGSKVAFAVMPALIDCDAHKLHSVRVYLMNTVFKRRLTLNCRSCFVSTILPNTTQSNCCTGSLLNDPWQLPSSFDMQCVSLHDSFVSSRCHLTIVSCRNCVKRRLKLLSYGCVLCTPCLKCCSLPPRAQEWCIYLT